jgi:hypothetical protein
MSKKKKKNPNAQSNTPLYENNQTTLNLSPSKHLRIILRSICLKGGQSLKKNELLPFLSPKISLFNFFGHPKFNFDKFLHVFLIGACETHML